MGEQRNGIDDIWGRRTPFCGAGNWSQRVDQNLTAEPDKWVQSCCVLCSNGCGMDIAVKDNKIVGVRGRGDDQISRGRLGPKGLNGWIANNSEDRLTRPLIRKSGKLVPTTWEEAMSTMVAKCIEVRDKSTPFALGIHSTGQLFLEEYHLLAMVGKAGLHTNNMDGNTRLCTATAAQALKETFGSDGQPGTYADIDVTECIFLAGHNPAHTQTVLWSRILDRLAAPNRPRLIVLDCRKTPCAEAADVHLAPKLGTNVAVLNGLLRLIVKNGAVDQSFIAAHTVGFDEMVKTVESYTPDKVEQISGIAASLLIQAGEILSTAPSLVSTALQGLYQSHQATAASCLLNNINLLRGMIGKPGCGILQMNGQPTSQNTRESGCDGEYPGFLNHQNKAHMDHLTRAWNVDKLAIPHGDLPSHAMEIFRHAETGSIKWLWIIGTNPAVSMPELHRIRSILSSHELFVIVQDAFLTETAKLADIVLPTALWGEKTGTFTNTDRTVHISHKAVDPPGEAKSDFEIFLDFAKRMDFRDKDGMPLIKFSDPEGTFNHWREFSKGLVPDYSGITYEKLSKCSGIQWPCNDQRPDGTARLYEDLIFPTAADRCETYGHDLVTGGAISGDEYKLNDPSGRARIRSCDYEPPLESTDDEYPFLLTTGRNAYQFHTRTKTARAPKLEAAAPHVVVEISRGDAERLAIEPGEELVVSSRRGTVKGPAQITDIIPGHIFIPFHYGYWDKPSHKTAANELTITYWDPVSKQPMFKLAAVQVHKASEPSGQKLLEKLAVALDHAKELVDKTMSSMHAHRAHTGDYLFLAKETCSEFEKACDIVSARYLEELDLQSGLRHMKKFANQAANLLQPALDKYGEHAGDEGKRLREALIRPMRTGSTGILHDLHDLYMMTWELHATLMILDKAAKALADQNFVDDCENASSTVKRMQMWFVTQFQHRAAQALIVPS